MWKLLTGIIGESMYTHLEERQLLPPEQKGGRKGCRGTKDHLMIDKISCQLVVTVVSMQKGIPTSFQLIVQL